MTHTVEIARVGKRSDLSWVATQIDSDDFEVTCVPVDPGTDEPRVVLTAALLNLAEAYADQTPHREQEIVRLKAERAAAQTARAVACP